MSDQEQETISPQAEGWVEPAASRPSLPQPVEEPSVMLDVHPAHHAANSWRDFFVHIATIVLGLCIAVGLEQTVEYIHHRGEVAEARRELALERKLNVITFAAEAEEFRRYVPVLKMNLAILVYLREHPHAPASKWPGQFGLRNLTFTFLSSAWRNAVDNHVIAYMPAREVAGNTDLYSRLRSLEDDAQLAEDGIQDWQRLRMYAPDPSSWSREEIDHQIELTTLILKQYRLQAIGQFQLASGFRDFHGSLKHADSNSIAPYVEPLAGLADPRIKEITDRESRARAAALAAAGEPAEDDAR